MGRIGRAIARRAQGFAMRVTYHNRTPLSDEIALMKKTAVLVNVSRGDVVDDAALIEALRDGRIAAAGLDVFEGEPKLNAGFMHLENAVLTPHIASATAFTRDAMAQLAIDNVVAALAGRRPPTLLNPQAWDNRRR